MSSSLKFRRTEFPKDWDDDVRMNFLFSTFRERCVNPEGYDAKINFWVNIIQDLCIKSQSPVISLVSLCAAFERKNRQPVCLDVVLEHMIKNNFIVSTSEYNRIEQEKGWIGWGFDVLVQKPVTWGLSSVKNFLTVSKQDGQFVVMSAVKDLADKILKRYYSLVDTKWTDNAVFLEHLRQECKEIGSDSNFDLAVIQLQKEKMAHVFEEHGEKVIKFRKQEEKKIEPLSQLDKGILSLKRARDTIVEDIDDLEEKILSSHDQAKGFLKDGMKTKAKLILMKKKRMEILLKKKSVALDNIENMLCQLNNVGSEKMVLNAYKTGAQAMKKSTKGELDLDSIDEIMSDVNEVLDDYSEIQSTLSKSVALDDASLEEFESELEQILAEEQNDDDDEPKDESPRKNSDEDLVKRLAALRAPPEVCIEGVPPQKKPALSRPKYASTYAS